MREASAQLGEGANMRVVRSDHLWQLGSIGSAATKTTGGVTLVAFWPKHDLRNNLRKLYENLTYVRMRPAAIALNYSVKDIRHDVRQII